ncbi:6426_t:CDS:2, partial [Racocetra persica]
MPCYADTIVRIKYVKQNVKEDSDLLVVWAIGTYPIEREDYDIELVLFVPVNLNDRDFETQAVFEKDNFFSVGGKIVPGYYNGNKRAKMTVSTSTHVTILNKVVESNKCPLKISLVGVPQEMPSDVKDDVIVKVLITDYIDTIHPQESLVFVVGQLEIIDNEFYVYAKNINYVDTKFIVKKKWFKSGSQKFSASQNSIWSKLLATHQNISENSKDNLERETLSSVNSGDFVDKSEMSCSYSLKRTRNDDLENSVEDLDANQMGFESCDLESNDLVDSDQEEEIGRPVKKRALRKN